MFHRSAFDSVQLTKNIFPLTNIYINILRAKKINYVNNYLPVETNIYVNIYNYT